MSSFRLTGRDPFDLEERFDAFQMNEHLPLVVGRSASVQSVVANRGFERRRCPELERLHRLHVVMTVDEYRGLARSAEPLTIDDRMPGGGKQLDILQSDRAHVVSNPLRASLHVLCVLGIGADAGNRKELF